MWGWPVALAVLLVGFLVPFPRTVDVTTAAVSSAGPGNETLLEPRIVFSIQGRCDRYLFRDDTFSGTADRDAERRRVRAFNFHRAYGIPAGGRGLCLSAGYVTNGGSVRTFSLWFDKALRCFELLPSAYPSSVESPRRPRRLTRARARYFRPSIWTGTLRRLLNRMATSRYPVDTGSFLRNCTGNVGGRTHKG